jgi:hypothetical protein
MYLLRWLRIHNLKKSTRPFYGLDFPFPKATVDRVRELLSKKRFFDDFTLINLVGGKYYNWFFFVL